LLDLNYSLEKANIVNKLLLERSNLFKMIFKLDLFKTDLTDFLDLFKLAEGDNDLNLLQELIDILNLLDRRIVNFELELLFDSCYDSMDAFVDIQAGSGGLDAQDWVGILLKMYTAWFEKHNFSYNIINLFHGGVSGIKSVSIKVSGKYVFGWLKHESGIHRLVRKSPFDSNKKRHTSFASVFIYPDNKQCYDYVIKESDLKIDTFRSGGAGGQHVNTTDSAVRIKHIPTGITVKCQSERSQHKNKSHAMKQLKSKLHALNSLKKKENQGEFEQNKLSIAWGNHIRSYILDKSLIKDVRSNLEVSDINLVLNGDLDPFVFAIFDMK